MSSGGIPESVRVVAACHPAPRRTAPPVNQRSRLSIRFLGTDLNLEAFRCGRP